MPFPQRTLTLDEKIQGQKNSKKDSNGKPSKVLSFWSIPQNQKQTEEEIVGQTQSKLSRIQSLNYQTTFQSIDYPEVQKKWKENHFTINLLDKYQPSLPVIKSISKAERFLVSPSEFESYQRAHLVEDYYESALVEVERKEEATFHKLNISSKAMIRTRKNVFQMQSNTRTESSAMINQIRDSTSSTGSVKMAKTLRSFPSLHKAKSSVKKSKIFVKTKNNTDEKWKLKDFFDAAVSQHEGDEEKMLKIKQKQTFLNTFQQIEKDCEKMEAERNNNKYVAIFGRFNSAVNTRLIKKQRKLEKVQAVFNRQPKE